MYQVSTLIWDHRHSVEEGSNSRHLTLPLFIGSLFFLNLPKHRFLDCSLQVSLTLFVVHLDIFNHLLLFFLKEDLWFTMLAFLLFSFNFCTAFLFLKSLHSLKQFGPPFINIDLFDPDLIEKLLGMRSYLTQGPSFHMVLYFFPVFAVPLKKLFKQIRLGGAPPSQPFFLRFCWQTMLLIHDFKSLINYTQNIFIHKCTNSVNIASNMKEFFFLTQSDKTLLFQKEILISDCKVSWQEVILKLQLQVGLVKEMASWFTCCDQIQKEKEIIYLDSSVKVNLYTAMPMVIEKSDFEKQSEECQKTNQSYIDLAFPANNQALGQFAQVKDRKIIWKRIPEFVEHSCIYSLALHPAQSILSVTSSGSHMKAALIALAFQKQAIHAIFDNRSEANSLGIYKLKVKIRGVLQWMVIDDRVPVFADTKRPLLCGTSNHQIWMMLVFKALAKITGSYGAIQAQDCFSVLDTFSTGPCYSYLLHPSISEDKETLGQILDSFNVKTNSICVSTSSKPKFNLHPDYSYAVSRYKQGLVELVGLGIDKQVSHKLSLDDLFANCSEMTISKADPNYLNSEPRRLQIKYNQPYFLRFDLWQSFSLVFNFSQCEKGVEGNFIRVMVGRKINQQKYHYVASKLEAYYQDMYLQCPEMNAGTYYIMIMINGLDQKTVDLNFVTYKQLKGQLTNVEFHQCNKNQVSFEPFLKCVLSDFALNAQRQTVRELPTSGSVLLIDELYRKGGFGYLTVRAGSRAALRFLRLRVNKREVKKSNYKLVESLQQDISIYPEKEVTLVFLLMSLPNKQQDPLSFPPGISVMQIF